MKTSISICIAHSSFCQDGKWCEYKGEGDVCDHAKRICGRILITECPLCRQAENRRSDFFSGKVPLSLA